jgi:hypothetical protein
MLKSATLALAALVLALAAPAQAQTPSGAERAAGPAAHCVSWGPRRLDCFSRGGGRNFVHRWRNGETWSGWEDLGGTISGIGSCTTWGENRIDCFARGSGGLWHRWYEGGRTWVTMANPFTGGWEPLGGTIHSQPSCVAARPNLIDCFARGDGDVMVSRAWDGAHWSDWRAHPGLFVQGAPHCIVVNDGSSDIAGMMIYCVARGPDSGLWLNRMSASHADGRWESLGGVVTSQPSCVARAVNDFHCFVRGTDNALHRVQLESLNRPVWDSWGGVLASDPSCVSYHRDRIDCFVRGTDGAMFQISSTTRKDTALDIFSRDLISRPTETLSEWNSLGGNLASAPSCYTYRPYLDDDGAGRIDCFALNPGRGPTLASISLQPTGPGRWTTFAGVVSPGQGHTTD